MVAILLARRPASNAETWPLVGVGRLSTWSSREVDRWEPSTNLRSYPHKLLLVYGGFTAGIQDGATN
jgi:hypothetical protein